MFSRERFLLVNGKFLVSVFTDRSTATPPSPPVYQPAILYTVVRGRQGFPKREVVKSRGKPL